AVRRLKPIVVRAAHAKIHFRGDDGEALRAPPFLHALGFGEALPHQLPRRIEHARDHEVRTLGSRGRRVTRGHHECFGPAMIIQPTPNLSATMPKLFAKKVSTSGCCTWPPCASASNMRLPSAVSLASSESEKPLNSGLLLFAMPSESMIGAPLMLM